MKKFVSTMFALFLMIALLPTAAKADNGSFTLTKNNLSGFVDGYGVDYEIDDSEGSTIVLGENITLNKCTYITADITLDLNGHTFTTAETKIFGIASGNTLTLIDKTKSGKIVISSSGVFVNRGTLKAHGGTIEGAVENDEYGTITVGNGVTTVTTFTGTVENKNSGVIEGGTFTGTVENKNSGVIEGGTFTGTVKNKASAKIKSGTFSGTVENESTISGGTFTGTVKNDGTIKGGTFSNKSTVTNEWNIEGGTFNGTVTSVGSDHYDYYRSGIHGGTFKGEVHNYGYSEINGGDFYKPVTLGKVMERGENQGLASGSPGYFGGFIKGGNFYGEVVAASNTSGEEVDSYRKNTISGGWFYVNVPEEGSALEYGANCIKVTYCRVSGETFLAMNVLKKDQEGSSLDGLKKYAMAQYFQPDDVTETLTWYTEKDCENEFKFDSSENRLYEDTTLWTKWTTKLEEDKEVEEDPWDNPFEDVHEYDWFYNSVKFCHKRGWFNGKTKTLFAPYDTFTRAEISAVLYNRAGTPAVNTNRVLYVDVKEGAWYTRAVYWMTDRGNAVGANNHFYPDNPVTREEMATMLYNAAGRPETNGTLFQYLDKNDASDWAYEALCWVVEKGIMIGDGDGTLRPRDNVTRAEAASIMRSFGIAGYGDYVATN